MNMRNFRIHPLFILLGCIFILCGQGIPFLVYIATALVHEFGHYYVADKLGLRLKNTSLTPFGAKLVAELYRLDDFSELMVAMAGPMVNLFVGIFFIALWWVFPRIYPYTELLVIANCTTALINLLPAYPLDGGRIAFVILRSRIGDRADEIVRSLGLGVGVILQTAFLILFDEVKVYTLLSITMFILLYSRKEMDVEKYLRKLSVYGELGKDNIAVIKEWAVDRSVEVSVIVKKLKKGEFVKFIVVYNGDKIGVFNCYDLIYFVKKMGLNYNCEQVVKYMTLQNKKSML